MRTIGFEALHSLYWLVVNLADQTPVLVLVDDCQWVDRDSLRFLAYLAQRVEDLSIAMVLAGRPPKSGSTRGRHSGRRSRHVRRRSRCIRGPSVSSAAISLTRERLGAQAAEEFCRSCYTATGGNPLFLGELLRALEAARSGPVGRGRRRGAGGRAGRGQPLRPASARRVGSAGDRARQNRRGTRGRQRADACGSRGGVSEDAARAGRRRARSSRHLRSRRAPRVRPSDRARRAVRGPHAGRATGAARDCGAGTGVGGCIGRARHRPSSVDGPDRGPAAGPDAQGGRDQRRTTRLAAGSRGPAAPSAAGGSRNAGARGDPDRSRSPRGGCDGISRTPRSISERRSMRPMPR